MADANISWQSMTPEQKRQKRFDAWLSPEKVNFISQEAEAVYNARVQRHIDAIMLKKPDHVPVTPNLGGMAANYCGYTQQEMMYDAEIAVKIAEKCTLDFQFDTNVGAGGAGGPSGATYDAIDLKLYNWPGHGIGPDGEFQFIEGEYMKADEYDAFLSDPSDFWWRAYLPRIWGIADGFAKMPPMDTLSAFNVSRFGHPDIQQSLTQLLKAGQVGYQWQQKIDAGNHHLIELGFPSLYGTGGIGGAPFDSIGDSLRGTRGIIMDMYRQPDVLLEALDVFAERRLKRMHAGAATSGFGTSPIVPFNLHKGADGFMSDEQFRTFYWPSWRAMMIGLIEEGFVPILNVQGAFNDRLEIIRDLPKGSVIWHFYYTDIQLAEEAVGRDQCIMGSVPNALLHTAGPEYVDAYCRKLIDTFGKDGGFIMNSSGSIGLGGKPENVQAMINCCREYGAY